MDMKRNIIFFALILTCVFVAGCGSIAPIFSNASDWVFYSAGAKAVSYDGKGTFQFVEGYRTEDNLTGDSVIHFVTADNYNKHYSAYSLITKVLKSIPQQIDTVYFAIADQFLVLRLKEENTAWIPNYEIREVENGKRPVWNIEAIGMGQSNLVKPSGNVIWRNLIKYGKNKFVVCVDRMIIKGKFVGIVYIINSSRKGYPRGMNWDVTKFVNIQSLGQVLEHDKKISEKILETNK